MPSSLQSESEARKELFSSVVFQRVEKRLRWSLEEAEYRTSLELSSNRHDWSPTGGIYLQISAAGSSPERSRLLCEVSAEEFAGRCVELSQEWDQVFWDVQMAQVQGALEKWRFDNKPILERDLKTRSQLLNRRLQLTIAAKQMKLSELKKGGPPELSEKTRLLTERLRDLQTELDSMWLQGVDGERVTDLEVELTERREQLKLSVLADQSAALNRLESELAMLQSQNLSPPEIEQAMERLEELRRGVAAVARARELALGEMSMFCLITHRPRSGTPAAVSWPRLLPSILAGLLALVCVLASGAGATYRSDSGISSAGPKGEVINPSP